MVLPELLQWEMDIENDEIKITLKHFSYYRFLLGVGCLSEFSLMCDSEAIEPAI